MALCSLLRNILPKTVYFLVFSLTERVGTAVGADVVGADVGVDEGGAVGVDDGDSEGSAVGICVGCVVGHAFNGHPTSSTQLSQV